MVEYMIEFLSQLANKSFWAKVHGGGWSYDNAKWMVRHWEDYHTTIYD